MNNVKTVPDTVDAVNGILDLSIRNGFAKIYNQDGTCYEGNWINGEKSGFGKETYVNGNVYEG